MADKRIKGWDDFMDGTIDVAGKATADVAVPSQGGDFLTRTRRFVGLPDDPSDIGRGIVDVFTGESGTDPATKDVPELPETDPRVLPRGRMSFGRSDLQKLDIMKKSIGSDFPSEIDAKGNVIVSIDEKLGNRLKIKPGSYFLNKPGASPQDVDDILTLGVIELFAVRGLGKVFGFMGTAGRFLGNVLGAGGGIIAEDVIAGGLGSEQGIDFKTAAIASAFAAGGEAIVGAATTLVPFFTRFLKNSKLYDRSARQVTDEGIEVLERAGVPVDGVTPEFVNAFEGISREAVDPAAAARVASAETLPVPVRLSRGEAVQDVTQQATEDAMLKGQLGPKALEEAKSFKETQNTALLQNTDAIQFKIGQGQGIVRGEGAERMQKKLFEMQVALKGDISTAYNIVEGLAEPAFNTRVVGAFHDHLRNTLLGSFDDLVTDSGTFIAKRLDELDNFAVKRGGEVFASSLKEIDIGRMYKWRQKLSGRFRTERGTPQGAAISRAIKEFDDFMEGAIDNKLFRGDVKGIKQWKKAIRLRRELSEKFESNNIVAKIVETSDAGEIALRFQPSEVANFLFGASGIGAKTGSANAARKIKALLGRDSDEWLAIKEEAVIRLFEKGIQKTASGRKFTGAGFRRSIDNATERTPELMSELFTKEDMGLLKKMRSVASDATEPLSGAVNFPNTAGRVLLLVDRMFGRTGTAAAATINKTLGFVDEFAGKAKATRAFRKPIDTPGRRGVGVGAAAGATGTALRRRRGPQRSRGLLR